MTKDACVPTHEPETMLGEASMTNCRWIVRRVRFGRFLICGKPVKIGSSFCTEHHGRVWRRGER